MIFPKENLLKVQQKWVLAVAEHITQKSKELIKEIVHEHGEKVGDFEEFKEEIHQTLNSLQSSLPETIALIDQDNVTDKKELVRMRDSMSIYWALPKPILHNLGQKIGQLGDVCKKHGISEAGCYFGSYENKGYYNLNSVDKRFIPLSDVVQLTQQTLKDALLMYIQEMPDEINSDLVRQLEL